ncbi:hypothetical protein M3P36_03460 [Altererythrobacter sp. KTW20L]|uniref:hypothetical protein n=1 Tax=Altererythrobacter sp. KTW20L TaxID=2942210 RepID=UPI0020BF6DFC|nr:hypothetical protein [Altererythrobacter sp. KTW20L]MCL6250105.1 hypothetical protein [Altererythrobacter sp. KTW20L]
MTNLIAPGRIALGIFLSCSLAACASGPGGSRGGDPGRQGASQMLERTEVRRRPLPVIGEPGRVAAADVRLARTAREEGQWTALARRAASGALIHLEEGTVEAASWLSRQPSPARATGWTPTAVWTSCDGSLAVSFGRYQQDDGTVGSYARVWTLRRDGEYDWTYEMHGPDNPQPPAPTPPVQPSSDVIVVPALDFVEGRVAECARGTAQPSLPAVSDGAQTGGARSDDGTLQWRWEHRADGTRVVRVDYLREGRWENALDFVMPVGGARL